MGNHLEKEMSIGSGVGSEISLVISTQVVLLVDSQKTLQQNSQLEGIILTHLHYSGLVIKQGILTQKLSQDHLIHSQ